VIGKVEAASCRFSVSAKKRTGAPELGCDRVNPLLGRLSILDPSPQLWGEPAFEGGSEFDFIDCFGYFFSTGRREAGFGVSFQFFNTRWIGKESKETWRITVDRESVSFG